MIMGRLCGPFRGSAMVGGFVGRLTMLRVRGDRAEATTGPPSDLKVARGRGAPGESKESSCSRFTVVVASVNRGRRVGLTSLVGRGSVALAHPPFRSL